MTFVIGTVSDLSLRPVECKIVRSYTLR